MRILEKYVLFWDGIYSQWYQANMTIEGITYNCCEQYMMHQKAITFNDLIIADEVLATKSPKDQKALGRMINGFNKAKWDEVCVGIVYKGNLAKFSQNADLKKELLNTGTRVIVEASPHDPIWGIGLGENDPKALNPALWGGTNLLGWSIMLVRNELS